MIINLYPLYFSNLLLVFGTYKYVEIQYNDILIWKIRNKEEEEIFPYSFQADYMFYYMNLNIYVYYLVKYNKIHLSKFLFLFAL